MELVILITLATVLSTLMGGFFAIKFKDKLHLTLGFSAGAVLGVALFDLIPESFELTKDVYGNGLVTLLFAAGFALYMIIDRSFSIHEHSDDCDKPSHNGKISALALIIHSFLDGFGIGLAFKISPSVGWVVALAVLAHDFSDGINTVGMILKDEGRKRSAVKWLLADALAPAVGIGSAYFLTISESTLGLILAFFVGLFLYISASDLIPESHHQHPAVWTSVMTILGMSVIYLVVNVVG